CLRSLHARLALDGVSWVQSGLVENAGGRGSAACHKIGAIIWSLPRASLPLGSSCRPSIPSALLLAYANAKSVPCRSMACMMMASRRARAIRALRLFDLTRRLTLNLRRADWSDARRADRVLVRFDAAPHPL